MSAIKLDVYKRNDEGRKEYDRTVESETAFLPFGLVHDIISTVNVEAIADALTDDERDNKELVKIMLPVVVTVMDDIMPLLLDTFPDATEDEIRECNTADIVQCVIQILVFSMKTMGKSTKTEKKSSARRTKR